MIDGNSAPLDLHQLRTFLAVYRAGSVTAGARLVGLSQPTVTTQLRALEERLGRVLFERLPRGVAPTAAADDLAAELAGPLDALEAIAGGAVSELPAPEPPVRLGGPAEATALLVLPALAQLVADGIRLRVVTGQAEDLLAGLRAGVHDLVVSAIRPRGRTLLAEPLMDEEFVLVASPGTADAIDLVRLAVDGPAALDGVPLVSYAVDLPILRRYWRHVFGIRLTADPALVVPDLRGVLAAVTAGAGVSVLPRYLCEARLHERTLVMLLEPEDPPINTVFLVRRTGAYAGPHVRAVYRRLLAETLVCRQGLCPISHWFAYGSDSGFYWSLGRRLNSVGPMARILFVVTGSDHWTLADGTEHPSGFWAEEAVAPYEAFTGAGHEIVVATPGGVVPTVDRSSLAPEVNGGKEGADRIAAALGSMREFRDPLKLEEVDLADYDAVFYPGGHGPMEDLAVNADSGALLARALESGKPVGVVCHGPAALLATRAADGTSPFAGYRLTGFTNTEERQAGLADKAKWLLQDRLVDLGADFREGEPWAPHVEVDRNLLTGQNPASSEPLATELLKKLT